MLMVNGLGFPHALDSGTRLLPSGKCDRSAAFCAPPGVASFLEPTIRTSAFRLQSESFAHIPHTGFAYLSVDHHPNDSFL